MVWIELGSDLVTPSWLPLALVVVIGIVVALLYRSMRRNIDRIQVPHRDELANARAASPTSPVPPQL